MKLIPLGVCGAYPKQNGATSSYYIETCDCNILLDFGSGALSRIQNYIKIEDIDAIVITHFHADHMSDMLLLVYYLNINNCDKIKVFMPNSESYLCQALKTCDKFEITYINEGEYYVTDSTVLRFFEVKHIVPTFGVKVFDKSTCLSYTSDTVVCDNLDNLICDSIAAICDCAAVTRSAMHMSATDALAMCEKHGVKCLMSHFLCDDLSEHEKIINGKNAVLLKEGDLYEFFSPKK